MIKKRTDRVWAVIPARGGSKSIRLKNLAPLYGRPLIDYVINAAKVSKTIDRIICSTDNKKIMDFCRIKGIEIHKRPSEMARDSTPILDVLIDLLKFYRRSEGAMPEMIALLQPTSPFILPSHINACVKKLRDAPYANSSQTISECPHNLHAYNQRIIKGRLVEFKFPRERMRCYNKQTKPKFYVFGNLVVARTEALLRQRKVFPNPSIPCVIPYRYAFDVDGPWDLRVAKNMLKGGMVKPHSVLHKG